MSAQGASLRRGIQLPIWPLVGVMVAAVVAVIGVRMFDDARRDAPAAYTGVFESTTALREQAAVPVVDPSLIFESSTGVRELGLSAPLAVNPGLIFESTTAVREAAPPAITYVHGLENPGAYVPDVTGRAGAPCPQCEGSS